jgi:pilus assembly protein CpaE
VTDTRILLVTPNAGYEQRIRQAFSAQLNGELRRLNVRGGMDLGALVANLGEVAPDVIALGPDLELDDALKLAQQLEQDRPEISVLLVSEPTSKLWKQALRAGVRDVLAPDAVDAEVHEVFDRALEVSERRRHNLVGEAADGSDGRIIAVLSPKGGSGKTTVASNLAVGLAQAEPDKVVIVDLDMQFGDVSTALRLMPEHTIADAARVATNADSMALKTYLTSHGSGLWALCGPDSPGEGEDVLASQAQAVVQHLAREFAYVVVDTCAGITEHTLSILDIATDLVLVCAMDVPSVRSLRKEVDALEQLGMTEQRRHFVINRADSKVGLDIKDVEATVGLPVDVALPSSRMVPLSMNQGSPLMESQPRSPITRQITALVDRFTEQPATRETGVRRKRRSGR